MLSHSLNRLDLSIDDNKNSFFNTEPVVSDDISKVNLFTE